MIWKIWTLWFLVLFKGFVILLGWGKKFKILNGKSLEMQDGLVSSLEEIWSVLDRLEWNLDYGGIRRKLDNKRFLESNWIRINSEA